MGRYATYVGMRGQPMLTTLTRYLCVLTSQLIGPGSGLHMVCVGVQRVRASATKSEAMAVQTRGDHG
jgi:hypothetical protein